ncbi:MAG TPA: biopolymer transporter ExbD [Spirochaetota bacterium]|nr:biopolymer transporter ExbD [Spirochaetota bacterium]
MDQGLKTTIKVKSKLGYRSLIDITSLVDMTFLLVAFFMVTSSFGSLSSITVHLPKAVQSGQMQHATMVISINEKNEVFVNDVKYPLGDLLQEFRKRKESVKDKVVIIRGDRDANYETIITVMDLLNQAGIPRFTLATVKPK